MQKRFLLGAVTSGAGASVLQVKAQRTLAAEGASCVHTPGAHRAGSAAALVHVCACGKRPMRYKGSLPLTFSGRAEEQQKLTLAAGGSRPRLLTEAGEPMALAADTHATVHARVRSAGVPCRGRAAILMERWMTCNLKLFINLAILFTKFLFLCSVLLIRNRAQNKLHMCIVLSMNDCAGSSFDQRV